MPIPHSSRVLLADLIDYAGLFPPAALDMATAVANYARYRRGEHAWMLGRFVLPASRLTEFEQALPADERQPWRLSVLVGPKLEEDMRAVEAFSWRENVPALIECFETKVASLEDIRDARNRIGPTQIFYEVPLTSEFACLLDRLKNIGGRAKIRTGGLTADAFPSTDAIARFLIECAKRQLPFKATAGLHHPVRCVKPFTYRPDSPSGVMHGFLNVLVAAALVFLRHKHHQDLDSLLPSARQILETTDSSIFGFADESMSDVASQFAEVRERFFLSFGSCSFDEPIADLRALNLL